MGTSTDGILAYGYDLGGKDHGWKVAEVDEYGQWEPDWLGNDLDDDQGDDQGGYDLISAAETRLMASVGFTEIDCGADGFFQRRRAAATRLGVEFESHCSHEYPLWLLSAHTITARRGEAMSVDFVELDRLRVDCRWDAKLAVALDALGITPNQERPGWILVSYWG